MTNQMQPPDAARFRAEAIMHHPLAGGSRERLARHLVEKREFTVEQVLSMLEAAAMGERAALESEVDRAAAEIIAAYERSQG